MKKINDIINQERPIPDIIQDLKVKNIPIPKWSDLEKEYEPKFHRVMTDLNLVPDKEIYDQDPEDPTKEILIRTEPATRIAIGLQKLSARLMGQFMFTLPVVLKCEQAKTSVAMKSQFKSLVKVFNKNRWDALNKTRCQKVSSQCEAAVYWYLVPISKPKNIYGFKSSFKIKYQIFTPKDGDILYPLFDDTGDMIAFSREITKDDTTYFDCWTDEWYIQWNKTPGTDWIRTKMVPSESGKIPITYTPREEPVWRDSCHGNVHEMEMLMSRNGETIAYNSAPVLILKGDLEGAPTKGDGNKVFTTSADGGAEYVSWDQSAEQVKFQFETLNKQFFTELQLADLSMESVKGIGASSGEERKWLMAGSHLKCGDEANIYIPTMSRDINIVKALLSKINTDWEEEDEEMDVDIEIRPFTIQSKKEDVDIVIAANGGKAVVSQKMGTMLSGLVEDPDAEYEQIKKEEQESKKANTFEIVEE